METPTTRPFYETIVEIVHNASYDAAPALLDLIMATTIPEDHDRITDVIIKKWGTGYYAKTAAKAIEKLSQEKKRKLQEEKKIQDVNFLAECLDARYTS